MDHAGRPSPRPGRPKDPESRLWQGAGPDPSWRFDRRGGSDEPIARGAMSPGRLRLAGFLCARAQRATRPGQLLPGPESGLASLGRDRRDWGALQGRSRPFADARLGWGQRNGSPSRARTRGRRRFPRAWAAAPPEADTKTPAMRLYARA